MTQFRFNTTIEQYAATQTNHFTYTYYGFNIKSYYKFKDLKTKQFKNADLVVLEGKVESQFKGENHPAGIYFDSHNSYLFKIEKNLLIQIKNGDTIIVESAGHSENFSKIINLYLLSVIFYLVLHQKGILLFHASSVYKNDKCVLFAGESGVGKSTIATEFCFKKNFDLICDDVCAIDFRNHSNYKILRSTKKVKILRDAFDILNLDIKKLANFNEISGKHEIVSLTKTRNSPQKIHSIFLLRNNNDNSFSIDKLCGISKVEALIEILFWKKFLHLTGMIDKFFIDCVRIAKDTDVYCLNFDKNFNYPSQISESIENLL